MAPYTRANAKPQRELGMHNPIPLLDPGIELVGTNSRVTSVAGPAFLPSGLSQQESSMVPVQDAREFVGSNPNPSLDPEIEMEGTKVTSIAGPVLSLVIDFTVQPRL